MRKLLLIAAVLLGVGFIAPVEAQTIIGGGSSGPCSAFGTASGTCAQGNDSRITGAAQVGSANNFAQPQTVAPAAAGTVTVDQAQATGGSNIIAVSSISGLSSGQVVSGANVPSADAIGDIFGSAQVTRATTGTAAAGQGIVPFTNTSGFAVGMQCIDTTTPSAITPGSTIISIAANVRITLSPNVTGPGIGSGDVLVCDPTIRLHYPTSAALAAATTLNLYANPTSFASMAPVNTTGGIVNTGAMVTGNIGINTTPKPFADLYLNPTGNGPGILIKQGTSSQNMALAVQTSDGVLRAGVMLGGAIYTQANILATGGFQGSVGSNGNITGFGNNVTTGISNMIEAVADTTVSYVSRNNPGGYHFQFVDDNGGSGNGIFSGSINTKMQINWGNGANKAAEDLGIGRNAAGVLEVNTGTAGSFADLKLRGLITNPVTVAGLPASPLDGQRGFVTDATACTFASSVTGGGSTHCPVYYDGGASAWKAG